MFCRIILLSIFLLIITSTSRERRFCPRTTLFSLCASLMFFSGMSDQLKAQKSMLEITILSTLVFKEFTPVSFKAVRANSLCATFLSISSMRCVRVRELRTRKVCHAKVCKQIWRPLRKVKKEIKVGDS